MLLSHSGLCNGNPAVNIPNRTLELQKRNLFLFLKNGSKDSVFTIQLTVYSKLIQFFTCELPVFTEESFVQLFFVCPVGILISVCLSRLRVFKSLLKTCQNKLLTKPYSYLQKKDLNSPVCSVHLQSDLAYQSRGHQLLDGCCYVVSLIFPLTFGSFSGVCGWCNWIPSIHTCREKNILLLVPRC